MLELIFGTYFGVWWLIFKRFKLLPINLWTSVTSILIVFVTIFLGFLWLGRYHPMTDNARTYAITTSIVSEVQGRVVEVAAQGNKTLEAGTPLFKIDPTQYEAKVASVTAQLDLAKIVFEQEETLIKQKAGNQSDFDRSRAEVDRLAAELRIAEYKLGACSINAPARGSVSQVAIRPGQMVTPMAFNQVMVFIHDEGPYLVGAFKQGEIEFMRPGDKAEFAFDLRPGRVYGGKVKAIQPLLAGGVLKASGALESFSTLKKRELVPVLFELDPEGKELNLPAGVGATVGVYTDIKPVLSIVRKIVLRIKSWENWLTFI